MGKNHITRMTIALLFLIWYSPAYSWEFSMDGFFWWTHEWYSQTGKNGFFGPYDVDRGTATYAGNLNFWAGGQLDANLMTGSDAKWSYFEVDFNPVIKMNEAIRLRGRYRITTFNDPYASYYLTQDAPGVRNTFSEGQWSLFWATAVTPWGTFSIGKRPWVFGPGLQYNGENSLSTESIAITAPYGPMDLGIGFYTYRYAGTSSIPEFQFLNPYNTTATPVPFGQTQLGQYYSRADASGSFTKDFLAYLVYHSGPLRAGVLAAVGGYHIGPEALLIDPQLAPIQARQSLDSDFCHGTTFLSYMNGAFFFNAEAAWIYWTDKRSGDGIISSSANYIEQWKAMIELGAIMGPVKTSSICAWSPGPDRRNGTIIDKQSAAFVTHPGYDRYLGNLNLFRPYSYLFIYAFGSGFNAYDLSGDGFLRDSLFLGTRLDYAVASNLNIFASVMSAKRTSNGYSWSAIGPNLGIGNFPGIKNGNLDFNVNRYPSSPNIPDTSLGYEIDGGLDWKLLEGFTIGLISGYWQPGNWFSYACIDRSVPNWQSGDATNNYGTRPGKKIDPVIGGEINMRFEF